MAESIIKDPSPMFIHKLYSCSYSIGGFEHRPKYASDFSIYPIQGYSIVGCYSWTSGDSETSVIWITPGVNEGNNNPVVMELFRKPNSSSSTTAYMSLLWCKSEYVE